MGGVGGTLAGNPVSMAATRATLEQVLTDAAFAGMIETASAFAEGIRKIIDEYALPWSVTQLGARVEYRFASPAPRNGTESAASADPELEDFLHLYLANRGVLLTPFHNMALMCPADHARRRGPAPRGLRRRPGRAGQLTPRPGWPLRTHGSKSGR